MENQPWYQKPVFLSSWAGSTACNWARISCDDFGSIVHLNLSRYGLRGTLHNLSFSSFSNILSFDLSYNFLYGPIPSSICHLSKLSYLYLSANQFTESIPFEVGQLTGLGVLSLAKNSLIDLYLYNNQLSSSIPKELGMLSSLSDLELSSNHLVGAIPNSLGNLSSLTKLLLQDNQLSDYIPKKLGMLSSLNGLDLSSNYFIGAIPASSGNLTNLIILYLFL